MQNRWFASAVALFVVVPMVATADDPALTVLDLLADVWTRGEVGPLGPAPENPGNRTQVLVLDGHNVYAVIEIERQDDRERARVNVTGFVECHYGAEAEADITNPIEMVRSLYTSFHAQCRAGDTVVVYPSTAAEPSQAALFPTGPPDLVAGPDGRTYAVQPLAYESTVEWPDGSRTTELAPAWGVPLTDVRDVDGRRFNFVAPNVLDELEPYGTTRVRAALLATLPP